jgi:hypothetical protein
MYLKAKEKEIPNEKGELENCFYEYLTFYIGGLISKYDY